MELIEMAVLGILILVFGGLSSGFWSILIWKLRDYSLERRVKDVEKQLESMVMTEKSALGVAAREQKAARMAEAMAEITGIMTNAEIPDKKTAIMGLAAKYPDIAFDIAKKHFGIRI